MLVNFSGCSVFMGICLVLQTLGEEREVDSVLGSNGNGINKTKFNCIVLIK